MNSCDSDTRRLNQVQRDEMLRMESLRRPLNLQQGKRGNLVICATCFLMVLVFAIFAVLTVSFPIIGWMLAFPLIFVFLVIVRHISGCIVGRRFDRLEADARASREARNSSVNRETNDDGSLPAVPDMPPSYDVACPDSSQMGNVSSPVYAISGGSISDSGNHDQDLMYYVNESYEQDGDEPPPPSYEEALRLKELEESNNTPT
ncbi:uncharacterized protein LOC102808620 [Saccoglossus kowalevskii]|uniref:Uncharacterized protein LOC102808620 n=1 Tax=Saccoglossus kowalevskii TaxID=10224 RepID=A0ABM0MMT7_SACKO|nr:PREDICTED: uncharacterized protein LOC102808620 [Saccoglossus kowalevskii]